MGENSEEIEYLKYKGVVSCFHIIVNKWCLIINVLIHMFSKAEILKTILSDHNLIKLDTKKCASMTQNEKFTSKYILHRRE